MTKAMLPLSLSASLHEPEHLLLWPESRAQGDEGTQVTKERVDPLLLHLISELFPGQHGLDFLARLLRLATEKQMALPALGLSETGDVAVISAQSLRTLAKRLGLSYDTTEKYVVVFAALRLLFKQRGPRQIILHFPLRGQGMCEPDALDQLLANRRGKTRPQYRSKVRSFAAAVKRRLVQLRERGELPHQLGGNGMQRYAPTHLLVDSVQLLKSIHQILEQGVGQEQVPALLLRIESALSRLSHPLEGRLLQKGDVFAEHNTTLSKVRRFILTDPENRLSSDCSRASSASAC